MAIAEAQAWVGAFASATTTVTATYGSTPTQGNILIACGRGTNVFSNASLSGWTLIAQSFCTSPTGSPFAIWYKIAGASEPTGVTLTWTASVNITLMIGEYSGLRSSPVDQTATNASDGTSSLSKYSGLTGTTSYPYALCLSLLGFNGGLGTITYGDGFALSITTGSLLLAATKIVNQRGQYSFGATHTISRLGGGIIVTLAGADQHGLLGAL